MIDEIQNLLPSVIETVRKENQEDMCLKFNHLLAENKLPLTNIASLLFKDIVEWYSLDQSTSMRYSPEVKKFWRVGFKLFKGRFLRFMCGMKNQGQDGCLKPSESAINFVVPDKKSLEGTDVSDSLKCIDPGILQIMIGMLNDDDSKQTNTYKMCFDGKKLNAGVDGQLKGDVNLWGNEEPPTLKERENQLKDTLDIVKSLETCVASLETRDHTYIQHASDIVKDKIITNSKAAIDRLSKNVSDLRAIKQNKEITLEKLKKACLTEELTSKYAYALSAVKTFIYRLNGCINKILKVIVMKLGLTPLVQ